MSRARFGKLIEVSGRAVAAWERGEHNPTPEHIAGLARLFGMPVAEMAAFLSGEMALKTFPRQIRAWFIWPEVQSFVGPSADRLCSEANAIARAIGSNSAKESDL